MLDASWTAFLPIAHCAERASQEPRHLVTHVRDRQRPRPEAACLVRARACSLQKLVATVDMLSIWQE
jgi:hypothetical protein